MFIRQQGLEAFGVFNRRDLIAMLAHAGPAVIFGIEMVLARLTFEDLAGGGDLYAFTEGTVSFMQSGHVGGVFR